MIEINRANELTRTQEAWLYYNGTGVCQDKDRAIQMWAVAAEHGCQEAEDSLLSIGHYGELSYVIDSRDPLASALPPLGRKCFEAQLDAAIRGDVDSQMNMARNYYFKVDCARVFYSLPNIVKHVYWLRKVLSLAIGSRAELFDCAEEYINECSRQIAVKADWLSEGSWHDVRPLLSNIQQNFMRKLNWKTMFCSHGDGLAGYTFKPYAILAPEEHHWFIDG